MVYIAEPNGSYAPISKAEDFECTYADSDDAPSYLSLGSPSTSFEFTCEVPRNAFIYALGLQDVIIEHCPDKRVAHLALYAKKARTRKKNFHRCIKILEVQK